MIISKYRCLTGLSFLGMLSILFSLTKGDVFIHFHDLIKTFIGQGSPLAQDIILNLRLPRTLSAFTTGALLALAGAFMQILLCNPLADPYVLGISGGSAVISLSLIVAGVSGYWLTGGAWIGSLIAVFIVFILAKREHVLRSDRLLLTGIALASGCSAMISFILVMSPDKELHSLLFWLLGDLSFSHMPIVESIILILTLVYCYRIANDLNILIRGEREAMALGINTDRLKQILYFLSALLTASAVSLAGCIGFIGLVIPHIFRELGLRDHQLLLPGAALLGGSLLTFADTFSRTIFAPLQLPVGIMTALMGIPVFLFLLHRNAA